MKDNKIINSFLIPVTVTVLFLMSSVNRETYIYDLLLNVFSVVLLGTVVWYIQFEYSSQLENQKELKKTDQLLLMLKSIQNRSQSPWNFRNETATFYFDCSRLVQLYNLFTDNNRFWDTHIKRRSILLSNDKLSNNIILFIDTMESSLMFAESIDQKIQERLKRGLSIQIQSPYKGDREDARIKFETNKWILRAYISGINPDIFCTEFSPWTNETLTITGVAGRVEDLKDSFIKDKEKMLALRHKLSQIANKIFAQCGT